MMLMRLARIVIVLSLCLWSAAAFPTNLVPRGSLLRNSRKIQRFNKCCCGQYPSSAHASMDASRKYSNGGFKNQFRTTIQRVLKNNVHASSIPDAKLQKAPQQQSPLIIKQANGFALSGSLLPGIRRLVAGGSQAYKSGVEAVQIYHHPGDVAVLALLSLAVNPIVRILHSAYYRIAGLLLGNKKPVKPYEDSKFSDAAQFVTQGGRIASIVYVVEVAVTFLVAVLASHPSAPRTRPPPNNLIPLTKVPDLFANCAYGYWLARKVVRAKSRLLQRYRLTDTYDAALDFIIYLIASILVLESSSVNLTALVRSLVAVGGLSSLVVGLALQGPATQILQGGLLLAANKFRKNEVIKLGDGTSGKVIDIGLMEVTILGGDDIQVTIPNSALAGQKLSNISRMKRSQIKYELKFFFHDIPKAGKIVDEIRQEIVRACPKLITDGSRAFRVMWTNIGDHYFVVTVDTHHEISPGSNEYWETNLAVLQGIANGTSAANVSFAMPVEVEATYKNL